MTAGSSGHEPASSAEIGDEDDIVLPELPSAGAAGAVAGAAPGRGSAESGAPGEEAGPMAARPFGADPSGAPRAGRRLSRRVVAALVGVAVVAAASVAVAVGVGRDSEPARTAQPSPAGDRTSTASTSQGSSSSPPPPTAAVLAIDPDKPPAVSDPTSFSEPAPLELRCPTGAAAPPSTDAQDGTEADLSLSLDDRGVRGAYVAVRQGGSLALVDRVERTVLWCARLELGGVSGTPTVPSSSSVGRPGYAPSLDADTLAAASPVDGPLLTMEQGRLWVLQPVSIARPDIGSQQDSLIQGFIAYDDTGKAGWLASFTPAGVDGSSVDYRRDQSTGTLYRVQSPDPDAEGDEGYVVARIDSAKGVTGTTWSAPGTGRETDEGVFVGGFLVASQVREPDTGDEYAVGAWRGTDGRQTVKTAFTTDYVSYGATSGHVVVARVADSPAVARTVAVHPLAGGAPTSLTLPAPMDLSSNCDGDRTDVLVCTGSTDTGEVIAALDLRAGKVRWTWASGDPDPVTGVPRQVPQRLEVGAGLVYALNDVGDRYAIDLATGRDSERPSSVETTSAFDPFGSVATQGAALALTFPQK